jgi:uncharacterized protein YecE (DUF72 family)
MDLEKAISFMLEQQAASHARQAESEARFNARMDALAEFQMEAERRHTVEIADIRLELKRAIQAGVVEARQERKRRNEMHEELRSLAAAQKITEAKLQHFIDSLNHSNGNQ